MGANSALRRGLKRALRPLLNVGAYRLFQATAMAWDIRSGNWQEPELDLVHRAVRAGDRVLDLGANYGLYTYHLSRAVGSRGRVYAFEPIPFTSATLGTVVRLLGLSNVEIIRKGCSDAAGFVEFDIPVQSSGAISAGQAHLARRDDDRDGKDQQVRWKASRTVRCEVVTIDEVLGDVGEVSFIKCDVEGAELLAFRGASDLITRWKPTVVCEINPWFLDGFGITLDELAGFFFDRGYVMGRYIDSPVPRIQRVDDLAAVVEDNYVFAHPSRTAALMDLL